MADLLAPQTTLPLVPDYAGETLAVDENTGNLCSGTFELTVNWGDENDEDNVTARIISIKDVCGGARDWFRHDSRDVGTIFLSGMDMDGTGTAECSGADATAPGVRFGCRAGGAEPGDPVGTAAVSGRFLGKSRSEGPLGVLGTWSVAGTAASGPDCKGSFGAGLKP